MRHLAIVTRRSLLESRHEGWVSLVDQSGRSLLPCASVPILPVRSTLKPFQALPLLELYDDLGLGLDDLAIAMASHSGEAAHVAAVHQLLKKGGVPESALGCGPHPPLHESSAKALHDSGQAPSAIHNNCSGKHAGMLAACRHHGYPLQSYLAYEHPLQARIRTGITQAFGVRDMEWGVDGCGAPIYGLALDSLARAYANLDARQVQAFRDHPFLIGGSDRFDTILMQALPVIAKGGAEALQAGFIPHLGLGWAVKIADGNRRAIAPVVLELLKALRVWDGSGPLSEWHRSAVTNHAGAVVGTIAPSTELATWLRAELPV